jgi:hypothetical protein
VSVLVSTLVQRRQVRLYGRDVGQVWPGGGEVAGADQHCAGLGRVGETRLAHCSKSSGLMSRAHPAPEGVLVPQPTKQRPQHVAVLGTDAQLEISSGL